VNAPVETVPPGATCGEHDVAASFVCDRCGTFGCADCLFATVKERSVCRTCASKGFDEPVAWERRKELGLIKAYFATIKQVLESPTRFFRTPTTVDGVFGAVAHGAMSVTLGLFASYVLAGLFMLAAGGTFAAVLDGPGAAEAGGIFAGYGCAFIGLSPVLALAAGPANALLGQVFAAGCAHGTLALAKKTKGSFEDTLRVCSYANAPYLLTFIPLLGSFCWFWVVGIEVIGLREVHGCGTDWAAFAAIGYRVAFVFAIVALYALVFFGLFAMLPPA